MKTFLLLLLCVFSLFTLSVFAMAAGEPAAITEDDFLVLTDGAYLCQYDRLHTQFDDYFSDIPDQGKNAYWDSETVVVVFMNGDYPAFYYDDILWECRGVDGLVQSYLVDPRDQFTDYQNRILDFVEFAEGFLVFVIVVILAFFCYKFLRMFF